MSNNKKKKAKTGTVTMRDRQPYDPMKDPRNPFSPVLPTASSGTRETPFKRSIAQLVKDQRGYHVTRSFRCALCGTTHLHGCEYTTSLGGKVVVCSYCRGEILSFKGWIHELPANMGHGKK